MASTEHPEGEDVASSDGRVDDSESDCSEESVGPLPEAKGDDRPLSAAEALRMFEESAEKDDLPECALPCALAMVFHGLALALCGVANAHWHGWGQRALPPAEFGIAAMGLMVACGCLSIAGPRPLHFVGVGAGVVLQLGFVVLFAMRSYADAHASRHAFVAMSLGSVLGVGGTCALRRQPSKAKAE